MRVLCLTFGDYSQASTFYRVHQYIAPLALKGIHLEPVPARKFDRWNDVPNYDAVLLQKALLRTGTLRKLRRLSRRLLYDVDDAIWHPHAKKHFFLTNLRQRLRLKTIAGSADLCIAANNVLAAHLRRYTDKLLIIPMALDAEQWKDRGAKSNHSKLRIGWSGHPVNFPYLFEIEPALLEINNRFPNVELAVFSGQKPPFTSLSFTHLPFAPGTEPEILHTFDIGLLPLPNDPFSAGKSPIKGLQYLASRAAVVLSPVGAAAEMFQDGKTGSFARTREQWITALVALIQDSSLRDTLAANGRSVFEQRFALSSNIPLLDTALTGSIPRSNHLAAG
jgi:glycosyltransferase involved in cell wall biosynthesis